MTVFATKRVGFQETAMEPNMAASGWEAACLVRSPCLTAASTEGDQQMRKLAAGAFNRSTFVARFDAKYPD
jgi:hypothetical protein